MSVALRDQTQALYSEYQKVVPAEIMKIIDNATDSLVNSNIGNMCMQVGDSVFDFNLPDAYGEMFNLKATLKNGPVVLSFYRGGWCTFCNLELKALQDNLDKIRGAGAELIAITPQHPDGTKETLEELGLDYPILTDQGNLVADKFGLTFEVPDELKDIYEKTFSLDIRGANKDDSYRLPVTATYVIDANGVIILANTDPNFVNRMEPDEIIKALESIRK